MLIDLRGTAHAEVFGDAGLSISAEASADSLLILAENWPSPDWFLKKCAGPRYPSALAGRHSLALAAAWFGSQQQKNDGPQSPIGHRLRSRRYSTTMFKQIFVLSSPLQASLVAERSSRSSNTFPPVKLALSQLYQ